MNSTCEGNCHFLWLLNLTRSIAANLVSGAKLLNCAHKYYFAQGRSFMHTETWKTLLQLVPTKTWTSQPAKLALMYRIMCFYWSCAHVPEFAISGNQHYLNLFKIYFASILL